MGYQGFVPWSRPDPETGRAGGNGSERHLHQSSVKVFLNGWSTTDVKRLLHPRLQSPGLGPKRLDPSEARCQPASEFPVCLSTRAFLLRPAFVVAFTDVLFDVKMIRRGRCSVAPLMCQPAQDCARPRWVSVEENRQPSTGSAVTTSPVDWQTRETDPESWEKRGPARWAGSCLALRNVRF